MNTQSIQQHYDLLSPYYTSLWDQHIHHGYFVTGQESRSEATDNLVRLLLAQTDLPQRAKVLDIGCGVGATSILFAEEFDYTVRAITISPEQVRIARQASATLKNPPSFEVQDANDLQVEGLFDLIWTVEMISHLHDRTRFFERAGRLLAERGYWCIAAWLKESDLPEKQTDHFIRPIEDGMLVNLPTREEYFSHFRENGLRLTYYQDISQQVAKTWDISVDLIAKPELWKLAREHGSELLKFVNAFRAMQAGFRSGSFRYVVMVVVK